ncbi:MAG: HEAT repeat domain-containing protein [Candidatus Omnitrophica bacterium]|nr:HEAT repeat domain-containing protein [Candidatus Omnitrophota bacterium]
MRRWTAGAGCLLVALAGVLPPLCAEEAAAPSTPSPEAQRLIAQLEAPDAYQRQMAFMKLELLREPATVPVLRSYLTSRHPDTRAFAVRAMAAVAGNQAVPELVDLLKRDRHPRIRIAAILAIEPLTDPAILPALIDRLRDRHPEVRMAALDAVSRVDDPRAKDAILARQRRERHRDVQRVLFQAVKRIQG